MLKRLLEEKRRKELMPKDTTEAIWEDLFEVRVPMIASRGIEDIRKYGVMVSGVKTLDSDIKNRLITTYITIDQMVEHFRNNVPVYVRNYSDTKIIYERISAHIQAWKYQLERGVNIGGAPVEDLMIMDQFANKVYDHAKFEFNGEVVDSLIASKFRELVPINVTNFFDQQKLRKLHLGNAKNIRVNENGDAVINSEEDDIPERDSYEEFFQQHAVLGVRR